MIKYFKELLKTLKSIDAKLSSIEGNSKRLAECVRDSQRDHGDRVSISTKHWND